MLQLKKRIRSQAAPGTVPPAQQDWIGPHQAQTPIGPPAVRLAQSTEFVNNQAQAPIQSGPPAAAQGKNRSIFQGFDFTADWAPRLEDDSLGRSTISANVKLGVPPPITFGTPTLVNARWGLHLLDGPSGIDVPSRLNDFEIGFRSFRKINDRWMINVGATVGVYGDDYSLGESDALRVSGSGVAIYKASDKVQWAFGAAYLNRDDISVIPAVGVIYDQGWIKYELMMPRPRIVWRLDPTSYCQERSVYLAGELGGGTWAVRRDSGVQDTLNISRFGILIGYEQKYASGIGQRYEFGYLFGRDIEYGIGGESIDLEDSLIARAALSF